MTLMKKSGITFIFMMCSLAVISYLAIVVFWLQGGMKALWCSMATSIVTLLLFVLVLASNEQKASHEQHLFAAHLFFLTFCLQAASAFCYPIQAYKSRWTEGEVLTRHTEYFWQTCLFFTVYCSVVILRTVFKRKLQREAGTVLGIAAACNFLIGAYFLATPGIAADFNDIMIGLPLVAVQIIALASHYSLHRELEKLFYAGKRCKVRGILSNIAFISYLVIFLGYTRRHELGIPIFFILTLSLWFLCEYHRIRVKPKLKLSLLIGLVVVISVALILIAMFSSFSYPKDISTGVSNGLNWLSQFDSKVDRIFLPEDIRMKFVQQAGLFGSSNYVYDIAANNDYALGLQIHTFGITWLGIILLALKGVVKTGLHFLSVRRDDFDLMDTAKSISFFCILIFVLYPLFSNIGLLPIIGVSPYASGYSRMHSLLSATLLALVLFERRNS